MENFNKQYSEFIEYKDRNNYDKVWITYMQKA